MPTTLTKRAIKESFVNLLNERPLNKISVRDITDKCGINRNSFYYHYQDIPALMEEILTEQIDDIIEKYSGTDSLDEFCFDIHIHSFVWSLWWQNYQFYGLLPSFPSFFQERESCRRDASQFEKPSRFPG